MKKTLWGILAVVLLLSLFGCGKKNETSTTWQEQYDLGVRYLSEGNYEEAILAFEAAIEIDPKQVSLYAALADAYMSAGEYDKAAETLEQGRAACGGDAAFERIEASLEFLASNTVGIRITEFYFDKAAYQTGQETEFLVSVAYCCPDDVDCILMIGANTREPNSYHMMDEDFAVSGSGGYQFKVNVAPVQWENALFGIYVNLSEANHGDTWTPFATDTMYIDAEGNLVADTPYYSDEYYGDAYYGDEYRENDLLLQQGMTDNMIRADEITFLGNSVLGLDISTMEGILQENGFGIVRAGYDDDSEDYWWIQGDMGRSAQISALQYKDAPQVCLWGYSDYGDYENLPIGVRDIYTDDTLVDVLTKLGFANGAEVADAVAGLQLVPDEEMHDELRMLFDVYSEDFGIYQSGANTREMEDGNHRLNGFTISLYFYSLEGYNFEFSFVEREETPAVFVLEHYNVHWY